MEILALIGGAFVLMVIAGVVKGFLNAKAASDELDRRLEADAYRRLNRLPESEPSYLRESRTRSQRMADAEYQATMDRRDETEGLEDGFLQLARERFPEMPSAAHEDMAFWMAKAYTFENAEAGLRMELRASAMRAYEGLPNEAQGQMRTVPWQKRYLETVGIA